MNNQQQYLTLVVCKQNSDLHPAHDEQELQEGKHWKMEITLVIIQALSSEQASQEERVNRYRYDLQQTHWG